MKMREERRMIRKYYDRGVSVSGIVMMYRVGIRDIMRYVEEDKSLEEEYDEVEAERKELGI